MRGKKTICVLQTNNPTQTGTGSTPGWSDVQAFPGVLNPVSQTEQKAADKDTLFAEYTLLVGRNDIRLGNRDQVKVANRIRIGEKYYNIRGANEYTHRGRHWVLRLEDVTEDTDT